MLETGKRSTLCGIGKHFPAEIACLESFMPTGNWFRWSWYGSGKERMTWLGEQCGKKGLDKMWGLRDHSMFPEMDGANCGR